MSHIHVCLVSEQTIPNILGIHHFKPDKVIFCTTTKMELEKRTDAILETLKLYGMDYSLQQRSARIPVDQDCLEDCEAKIASEIEAKYRGNRVTVNLTGGTKIMVLAAYNALRPIADQMIYTPIPRNEYLTVFPSDGKCKPPVPLQLRLSVEAYVTAYGVRVKNRNSLQGLKNGAERNSALAGWMVENYRDIETLLSELWKKLKDHRNDKQFQLTVTYEANNESEATFLKKVGVKGAAFQKTLSKSEIRFLTGDWLSDFCYNEIAALAVDDCVTGIELVSPKGTDNEFDVMFTKDNALYIVECKSLRQLHDKDGDILYKISALQHDFGLRVKGFLVSTARSIVSASGPVRYSVARRAAQCNTTVIHPDDMRDLRAGIAGQVKGLA